MSTRPALPASALDTLFREARTHSVWLPTPVSDELLQQVYDLFKFGPTSANGFPGRVVFVKSEAAKARLLPAVSPGNVEKVKTAPVTAIVAYDMEFYQNLPRLFPAVDARSWFVGNDQLIAETAKRNGTLQGAYLILAARSLGLDAGPMSGFDPAKVNAEFFPEGSPEGKWKANFLCNIGYGDYSKLHPRLPRLTFAEACRIL
jgi:3-hydroxypropanoate dehydrogenase